MTFNFRRAGVEIEQRLTNSLGDQSADVRLPVESHFTLCRVDIHIHGGGIDFQEQAANGVAPLHERGVIAFKQREAQSAILHRTAIDEDMLVLAGGARNPGRAHETP